MALCPECGGRLGFARLFRWRPRTPVECPWCRSRLMIRPWVRRLRDGLLVVGGSVTAVWAGVHFFDSGSDLYLFWGLGAWLVLLAVAGMIETAAPLETRVPRDFRDWGRETPPSDTERAAASEPPPARPETSLEPAEKR